MTSPDKARREKLRGLPGSAASLSRGELLALLDAADRLEEMEAAWLAESVKAGYPMRPDAIVARSPYAVRGRDKAWATLRRLAELVEDRRILDSAGALANDVLTMLNAKEREILDFVKRARQETDLLAVDVEATIREDELA